MLTLANILRNCNYENKKNVFCCFIRRTFRTNFDAQAPYEKYESFLITEKTTYKAEVKDERMYYLHQVNRKEWSFPFEMIGNSFKSLFIFIKERPVVVITTGVLAMIPMCLLAKVFGKKLIYIESSLK